MILMELSTSISDGLVDCEDPECCLSSVECRQKQLCTTVDEPTTLAKADADADADATKYRHSFWDRIKFLVDETTGIQRYAKVGAFDTK